MERNDRSGKARWKDDALQLVTKCFYTYSFEMYDARLNDWLENLEKERGREARLFIQRHSDYLIYADTTSKIFSITTVLPTSETIPLIQSTIYNRQLPYRFRPASSLWTDHPRLL